jgi:hypothetical protein
MEPVPDEEHGRRTPGDEVELPTELRAELAVGLARSLGEILVPPQSVTAVGTGISLCVDGRRSYVFDVVSPSWPRDEPLAASIEGDVQITLGQIQAELAEVTTEPWPGRSEASPTEAHGLPDVEAELTGNTLNVRFRWGSAAIELAAIKLELDT